MGGGEGEGMSSDDFEWERGGGLFWCKDTAQKWRIAS